MKRGHSQRWHSILIVCLILLLLRDHSYLNVVSLLEKDSRRQQHSKRRKNKDKKSTFSDNDKHKSTQPQTDNGESIQGIEASIVACDDRRRHRRRHQRNHHRQQPPPPFVDHMQRAWEHFLVNILHLPSGKRQKHKRFVPPHQSTCQEEKSLTAAQLQLAPEEDDRDPRGGGVESARRGRRMARIVRPPDYYGYPLGCFPDTEQHHVDVDQDDADADASNVFALENTKCDLQETNHDEQHDYYMPPNTDIEPHIGMILEVSDGDDDKGDNSQGNSDKNGDSRNNNNNKVRYQLTQPMEAELGTTVKHAADYAYIPVLSARIEPILVAMPQDDDTQQQQQQQQPEQPDHEAAEQQQRTRTTDASLVAAKERRGPDEWWQWWIPWSTWRQQQRDENSGGGTGHHHHHHQERYRMKENKAFAGGSHGQVWMGTRRCEDDDTVLRSKRKSEKDMSTAAARQYQFPLNLPSSQEKHQEKAHSSADEDDSWCGESLVLKKLKVEQSYRILEAGLREIYFGQLLLSKEQQRQEEDRDAKQENKTWTAGQSRFTRYVDHFFLERSSNGSPQLELWIVYRHAGPSLRSYLYTGSLVGDYMIFQNSLLWTQLRQSMSKSSSSNQRHDTQETNESKCENCDLSVVLRNTTRHHQHPNTREEAENGRQDEESHLVFSNSFARDLVRTVLKQILQAAAYLHENGIQHRDIKPSNVMCETKLNATNLHLWTTHDGEELVNCVLGDFSSAYNDWADEHLYTGGPSRAEQTDEYAPPEAIFGRSDMSKSALVTPAFDSWSIGIVALELLMGTPNVFSVDQRTKAVLTQKLKKRGASERDIDRALYLAALSQFCIYNPLKEATRDWPYRDGDPLQLSSMVKESCTMKDFRFALQARDPLGIGFDSSSDPLLHLIWQLLAWNPNRRMTPAEALNHPYFTNDGESMETVAGEHNALESQMLDPRMDFNASDIIHEFRCPKCGRVFGDWMSCHSHAVGRKHAHFCDYNRSNLPTCLNAHSMLPAHPFSGYCDIQGRRKIIEDFHAIHLLPSQQFYGIFDGHTGNLASKYVASFLYGFILKRIDNVDRMASRIPTWKEVVKEEVSKAFVETHQMFLEAISLVPHIPMDQSGTTATVALVSPKNVVIASLGDSRAVLSSLEDGKFSAVRLTHDHIASDPIERKGVEERGGHVITVNGVKRVNGTLVVSRSIGDANLAPVLSQTPDVISFSKQEIKERCGDLPQGTKLPCFIILASDGLWDKVSDLEAVHMVAETVAKASNSSHWKDSSGLQQSAEALVQEAYVRGSTDNIGVCVVAIHV